MSTKSKRYALVFWIDSKTTSVISTKYIKAKDLIENKKISILWEDREEAIKKKYYAKIIQINSKYSQVLLEVRINMYMRGRVPA